MKTILEDAWDEVQNVCGIWVYETLGAEFDRLTAELDQVKYDRSVKHDMAAEQIDELTKELDRYKQGVEVEDFVNHFGVLEAEYELPSHLRGKRVRVLIMKEEVE